MCYTLKAMEVIPAIDIKGGKVVRLFQGDFSRETIYSSDPLSIALQWQNLGAKRLHIIDLDGALQGKPVNLECIAQIVSSLKIPVQLGGGIRDLKTIEDVLKIGINRVILGTIAVKDKELLKEACQRFGEAIIVSLDVRDGKIAIKGWREQIEKSPIQLIKEMELLGVKRFIYTDISRDGTLTQPDYVSIKELLSHTSLPILVSGGISSLQHLKELARMGVEGAIIGKALYVGAIDLKEALRIC